MKYPIGIQDFGSIREGGYVYVDKTRDIFNVLNSGSYLEAFVDGTKKRIAGGGPTSPPLPTASSSGRTS